MTAVGDRIGTIRDVRIAGPGRELLSGDDAYDVFLDGDAIADIAPSGALRASGEVLDAAGAWLVPGLWDHHVHTVQWALGAEREPLGAAGSAAHAAALMRNAPVLAGDRRVGAGFRDALWPDAPSLELLDAATGGIPTYLISADVHSVWLNSAAFAREGFDADATGMLRETDAFEISRRLNAASDAGGDASVARAAREAAARGVVGIVDLDMAWNAGAWARRLAAGFDVLRVDAAVYPDQLDRAIATGLRSGDMIGSGGLVRVGPLKIITDGSLGTRTAACSRPYPDGSHGVLSVSPEELAAFLADATAAGFACAVHAIGDVAVAHALDAFARTGAAGTIEHAQLVTHADLPRFARLGVGASVQPAHALDDRDLATALWSAQTALAYPLRSLVDRGAKLLFGSDAPVAAMDPWATLAAAVFRTRGEREPWHPEERLDAATALAASTAGGTAAPARIAPRALADLVLCGSDPVAADEPALREMPVHATLLAGRLTHLA
ncbi:amidohydrolase family protein [Microbacterium sp. X-17]|uniref:amidohydrolase n=1 Tax=Microbacterium sp. X-17 TaxID=3144404 RepID=UPI0031F5DA85